jgi:hypothetical protein
LPADARSLASVLQWSAMISYGSQDVSLDSSGASVAIAKATSATPPAHKSPPILGPSCKVKSSPEKAMQAAMTVYKRMTKSQWYPTRIPQFAHFGLRRIARLGTDTLGCLQFGQSRLIELEKPNGAYSALSRNCIFLYSAAAPGAKQNFTLFRDDRRGAAMSSQSRHFEVRLAFLMPKLERPAYSMTGIPNTFPTR